MAQTSVPVKFWSSTPGIEWIGDEIDRNEGKKQKPKVENKLPGRWAEVYGEFHARVPKTDKKEG